MYAFNMILPGKVVSLGSVRADYTGVFFTITVRRLADLFPPFPAPPYVSLWTQKQRAKFKNVLSMHVHTRRTPGGKHVPWPWQVLGDRDRQREKVCARLSRDLRLRYRALEPGGKTSDRQVFVFRTKNKKETKSIRSILKVSPGVFRVA